MLLYAYNPQLVSDNKSGFLSYGQRSGTGIL